MPRGSRSRSGGGRPSFQKPSSRSQSTFASRPQPSPNVPAAKPNSSVGAPATPQQPGLFANMASTAAGVAVGSTIGHTLGHAITGGFSSGGHGDGSVDQQQQQQQQQQRNPQNPCEMEMKSFLECAQQQTDINLCQGFNEALKQCKMYYQVAGNS